MASARKTKKANARNQDDSVTAPTAAPATVRIVKSSASAATSTKSLRFSDNE